MRVYPDGRIEVSGSSIMLDRAARNGEPIIISHAHADHAVRKGQIFASPETKRLMEVRYGVKGAESIEYGVRHNLNGTSITLYPAGHILGSAQVLIQAAQTSLLYSGDIKLRPPQSCAPIRIPHAQNLILEATFGTHIYQWPRRERIEALIENFIVTSGKRGKTPVFLAYSLGKSQELLAILARMGAQVSVSRSVYQMSKVYEEFGIDLGSYTLYEDTETIPGVLVIPPQRARHLKLVSPRYAMVSGWAITRRFNRYATQIPLSDHADFGELLRYVDKVKPAKVWTTHGYAKELATALRHRGYDAQPLDACTEGDQLTI